MPRHPPLFRLIVVGALTPVTLACINEVVLSSESAESPSAIPLLLVFAWLILQTAAWGLAVARWIEQPVWRAGLYAWGISLVNVHLINPAWDRYYDGSEFAAWLLSGQLAMLALWAFFGEAFRTPFGIYLFLCAAPLNVALFLLTRWQWGLFSDPLPTVVALALLAIWASRRRSRGYALLPITSPKVQFTTVNEPWRFSLKDVLIWSTLSCIGLAIWVSKSTEAARNDVIEFPSSCIAFFGAFLTATWAMLGIGLRWAKVAGAAAVTVAFTAVPKVISIANDPLYFYRQVGARVPLHRKILILSDWVAGDLIFPVLLGLSLAASLIFLRAVGWRLMRISAPSPPSA